MVKNMIFPRNSSTQKFQTLKKQFRKRHRYLSNNNARNFFGTLSTNRQKWDFINKVRNPISSHITVESPKNSFGTIVRDSLKIANLFNYSFSTLGVYYGTVVEYVSKPKPHGLKSDFNFRCISKKECLDFIKALNSRKPVGPSDIPAWALKDGKSQIYKVLTQLINLSILNNEFPDDMKKAIVTPIFKKGQPNDPTNYRPISVTSALAKLLEKVLCSQIREFLKCNHTLNDTQFGFRKHFSTTDALLYTTETIRTHVDKGKYVSGLFLDLSKAFDSISHPILIDKLGSIGFSNNASGLIQNYLTNRTQRVKVNNVLSDWITVKQGVPQGTNLGPLLFLLYVNDISLIVPHHCQIIQYADDTFIFSAEDNLQEANKNVTIGAEPLQLFFC